MLAYYSAYSVYLLKEGYFVPVLWEGESRRIKKAPLKQRGCGDEWARTTDSRIFSPMLYQLSYITVSGYKTR